MNDSASPAARRAVTRAKIFQPGDMHTIGGVRRIHLLDLSRFGALIYGSDDPPAVNSVVRLTAVAPLGVARVKWVSGKKFGVSFATPLSDECLDQLVHAREQLSRQFISQPLIPPAGR